jgi:hypothetical protein
VSTVCTPSTLPPPGTPLTGMSENRQRGVRGWLCD